MSWIAVGASVVVVGYGALGVLEYLSDPAASFASLALILGTGTAIPGLATGAAFGAFLARRGGRVPFFLGVSLVAFFGFAFWLLFRSR